VSGKTTLCNGKEGKEGSPWTASGTLPSGKTEAGTWGFGPFSDAEDSVSVPIASFPIPLAAPLVEGHAHFIASNGMEVIGGGEEVTPTECGSAIGPEVNASNPQAKPGSLCVYETELQNAVVIGDVITAPSLPGKGRAGTTGAYARVGFRTGTPEFGRGTWAVTAE
jgi:hypothetical protein